MVDGNAPAVHDILNNRAYWSEFWTSIPCHAVGFASSKDVRFRKILGKISLSFPLSHLLFNLNIVTFSLSRILE